MTKIEMEKSLKLKFREQKKRLEDRWEQERAKWGIGVGSAFLVGIALGRMAR